MQQIASALCKAQSEFGPALKNKANPHLRAKYADLQSVLDAVMESLNRHGIFLTQKTTSENSDHGISVETVFLHESGESLSSGVLFVPAPKNDPQGFGSALTYARRYSLLTACGIAPEDDDGQAAVRKTSVPHEMLNAARDAAMGGMKSLSAYIKSLTEEQRSLLGPESAALKAAAKAADEAKNDTPQV